MSIDLKDNASLLGSRICHDLISPLGAISNGLELLSMAGAGRSPELQLIEESIASANARIKFFRVAFGASSGTQMMARAEVIRLLEGYYSGGRLTVRWNPPSDPTRTEVKVALLALLCMETVLPHGGEIVVQAERGNWQLQAFGETVRFEADHWASLGRGAQHSLGSAQVHFLLLKEALAATGQTAQVGHSDSAVSIRF